MACYHPMPAVRMVDGSVKFVSRNKTGVIGDLELPCGQCVGCRLERSRQWAMRCMHEASLFDSNLFVTLTYDDANLPAGGTLVYRDFQLFMKRLRKKMGSAISFYVGGEYGETNPRTGCVDGGLYRPHFHACLFNVNFEDRVFYKRSPSGEVLWRSPSLEKLWPFGHSSFGHVTFQSAAYIARYCLKKVNGDAAEAHYAGRLPEFNHMSLKPAVGLRWLQKFHAEVYPRDYVIVQGVKVRPPKYYDEWFQGIDSENGVFSELRAAREFKGYQQRWDNTVERLAVREAVHKGRLSFLKRSL